MHQPTGQPHPAGQATSTEDLQVLTATALTDLVGRLPNLRALVHGHQRGLGILTADARAVMDDLVRQERRDRVRHAQEGVQVTGESPTPGNLQAWALLAEIDLVLGQLCTRIVDQMNAAGVCPLVPRYTDPATEDLAHTLRDLIWRVHRPRLLELTWRDLEDLTGRTRRVLDGDDKVRLDAGCPHCGRPTLLVTFATGVIRCDRDPHSGRYENCVCADSYCPCHQNPRHRHEWHRDKGTTSSGWWALSDRLSLQKQITS